VEFDESALLGVSLVLIIIFVLFFFVFSRPIEEIRTPITCTEALGVFPHDHPTHKLMEHLYGMEYARITDICVAECTNYHKGLVGHYCLWDDTLVCECL
jgi:hypothetical protein